MAFLSQDAFSSYLIGGGEEDCSLNFVHFSEDNSPVSPLILPSTEGSKQQKQPTAELFPNAVDLPLIGSVFSTNKEMYVVPSLPSLPGEAILEPMVSEVLTMDTKTTDRKRKNADTSSSSKVKQLERNRISAKANRLRKKQYITELEKKVKTLKQQLEEAKQKLAKYELNSKMQCTLLQDSISQIRPQIQQMMDKIVIAHKQYDINSTGLAIQAMFLRYGAQAEERKRTIEVFVKRIVDLILPFPYKYLIWAAEHNSGFYDIMNLGPSIDYAWEKKEKNEWETVIDYVKTNEETFKKINNTKDFLLEHGDLLRRKVKAVLKAKSDVFEEAAKIDTHIQEKMLKQMPFNTIGAFIVWLEKMKNKPELSDISLYKLTKEDFSGIDCEHIHPGSGGNISANSIFPEGKMRKRPLLF